MDGLGVVGGTHHRHLTIAEIERREGERDRGLQGLHRRACEDRARGLAGEGDEPTVRVRHRHIAPVDGLLEAGAHQANQPDGRHERAGGQDPRKASEGSSR